MKGMLFLLAALAVVVPALSQVTARQGTTQDTGQPNSVTVKSPMVVEVTIPAWKPGVEIVPTLTSGWYRQDLDLTVTLFEADGKTVLGTKFWDDLTIGAENAASALGVWGSSSSKSPSLVVGLTKEMVARFEAEELQARIVLDIQDDDDDDDDDA